MLSVSADIEVLCFIYGNYSLTGRKTNFKGWIDTTSMDESYDRWAGLT